MTNLYHQTIDPPFRIQKRLVLNQCYRKVIAATKPPFPRMTYVTFGGAQLYDLMDLFSVFDIRQSAYSVYSFETLPDIAEEARKSVVAKTLGMAEKVSIRVICGNISDNFASLNDTRQSDVFIYFLDFCDCFRATPHQSIVDALLQFRLLKENDFLVLTSCLVPRVIRQERFMAKDVRLFSDYFGVDISDVTMDFKERNHVDLLINQSFVRNGSRAASEGFLVPDLLCKYRYRDSRVPMGVWAYAINRKSDRITGVPDCLFDEYPWPTPIDIGPEVQEDVDLFSDLL